MARLELPLPELVIEDFQRGWTRFEFVAAAKEWDAAAKEWDAAKQLTVIPTLLRGKLIDYYVELADDTKSDLGRLKAALQKRAGITPDPLVASKQFNQRNQSPDEKVKDFASTLKRLFKNAYPDESMASAVLLQRFLTGLRPEIGRQLLLRNRPTTFADALKDAVEIEYALELDDLGEGIHAVAQSKRQLEHLDNTALTQTLEALTKRLESLETTLQKKPQVAPSPRSGGRRYMAPQQQHRRGRRLGPCYNCGEEGHFYRSCPLNSYGPAPKVDGGWPRPQYPTTPTR